MTEKIWKIFSFFVPLQGYSREALFRERHIIRLKQDSRRAVLFLCRVFHIF